MNERLAAGLLAGISVALFSAEILLAALYGFDPGLILFCLSLYIGAAGLLFSLKSLLNGGGSRIESVSQRRARAKRGEGMGGVLEGYDVDEEFLGRAHRTGKPAPGGDLTLDDEALKAVIASYAGMAGGLAKLRETLDSIDEASFRAMARSTGMGGVTRERAIEAVQALLDLGERGTCGGEATPSLTISLDRETFDDYIRRCMTEKDAGPDEEGGGGFSVGLDAAGLSGLPSEPPTDFSHDPKAVFAKINRPDGAKS
ncbi:MAG: hypothetical protein HGB29_07225 [Chlorobiaceae bacterium]|nr:hypothetical protein [Chlorobiaceae bacterium]